MSDSSTGSMSDSSTGRSASQCRLLGSAQKRGAGSTTRKGAASQGSTSTPTFRRNARSAAPSRAIATSVWSLDPRARKQRMLSQPLGQFAEEKESGRISANEKDTNNDSVAAERDMRGTRNPRMSAQLDAQLRTYFAACTSR
jgi:hypothetical protein